MLKCMRVLTVTAIRSLRCVFGLDIVSFTLRIWLKSLGPISAVVLRSVFSVFHTGMHSCVPVTLLLTSVLLANPLILVGECHMTRESQSQAPVSWKEEVDMKKQVNKSSIFKCCWYFNHYTMNLLLPQHWLTDCKWISKKPPAVTFYINITIKWKDGVKYSRGSFTLALNRDASSSVVSITCDLCR